MASAIMIEKVKDSVVVITNPEHFSVALVYDPTSDGAPVLIAKGADLIALRIRNEAKKESVQLFESPDLARALYFTTEINQSIPEELYLAVAQIIAYVYNLNSVNKAGMQNSKPKPKILRKSSLKPLKSPYSSRFSVSTTDQRLLTSS